MKVKDIKPKQGNIDVVLDVVDVGPARTFEKFGKPGRVATAIAKDESGDVKLSLWNDEIDRIKAGDKVHLTNGWANEWQGEIQLSAGRAGKYEVVGKAEQATADSKGHSEKKEPIITNYKSTDLDDHSDDDLNVEEESIDDDEI